MKTKRFKVRNKYLYTFIRANDTVIFNKKDSDKPMLWTKKEMIYLEKAMNVLGEQYIRDYYCK